MNYIDVNVFVYWLNDHPEFGTTATDIISGIDAGNRAITSSITPWLLHIIFSSRSIPGYSYTDMLERITSIHRLTLVPLSESILETAGEISSQYNLDLEDAIHVATALQKEAQKIFSNDHDLDAGPIPRAF